MKKKDRLDNILVNRAMFPSREAARTAIMDGAILVEGTKVTKAGASVADDAAIEIIKSYNLCPYVSRGGLKLERALRHFALDVSGRVAIDAGASTGGFTDCLLQHDAQFVYAVDVGYGQLDWSLRQDKRVKVLERVNVRNLKAEALYGPAPASQWQRADLAVMDVSFISVTKTLPAVIQLLFAEKFEAVVLIKPQFEAGRENVGKGGVVRDFNAHTEVLEKILQFVIGCQACPAGITHSPIKGPQGNIEYLLYLKGGSMYEVGDAGADIAVLSKATVEEAFALLGPP